MKYAAACLLAQSRHHRRRQVDPVHRHPALGEWQRDPAGADPELERTAGTGQAGQKVDDRIDNAAIEQLCCRLVVPRGNALVEVAVPLHPLTVAPDANSERRLVESRCRSGPGEACDGNRKPAVDVPALDRIYDFYSFNVIPALGRMVAGDAESYRYLVESIRRFPKPQAFAAMLRAAGFARVSFQAMSGGIVTLHSGWRL